MFLFWFQTSKLCFFYNNSDFKKSDKFSDEFFNFLGEILRRSLEHDPKKRVSAEDIVKLGFFKSEDQSFFALPSGIHALKPAKDYIKKKFPHLNDEGGSFSIIYEKFKPD